MQETQTQREERKNMYISYVLARAKGVGDIEALIEEAGQRWERHNEIKISQELNMWKMR